MSEETTTGKQEFSHVVVVGSSAGGVEALSELVGALPADLGVPVVIAQHLDPERESHLEEILGRRSTLPVRTVTEHDRLDGGVVYVVPADRHINITANELDLMVDTRGRPKPSVDLLMETAAEVYGERLIAVVLSGSGTDGSAGARAVRKAGGTIVVQNPETARFGGMPGSIAPNTVDIVADLGEIGRVIGDLVSGVGASGPTEAESEALDRFLEELREHHGVDFRSYKKPTSDFEALDHLGNGFPSDRTPQARVAAGESFTLEFSARTEDGGQRAFVAEGRPINDGGMGGVILVRESAQLEED